MRVGAPASSAGGTPHPWRVLLHAARPRARAVARRAFPARRATILEVGDARAAVAAFRGGVVDAVVVDLGAEPPGPPNEEAWRVAELAREFPSAAFVGVLPLLGAGAGASLGRCADLDVADVLVDGVDDAVASARVARLPFAARFAAALADPPPTLGLTSELQRAAWRLVAAGAGRPVRTHALARALGVSREHLSRAFRARRAPTLKRVIDLVRLVAAAELSRNPGYDVRDVAAVLGFASSSHLASVARRVAGVAPSSLARLRPNDLVERFAGQGPPGRAAGG